QPAREMPAVGKEGERLDAGTQALDAVALSAGGGLEDADLTGRGGGEAAAVCREGHRLVKNARQRDPQKFGTVPFLQEDVVSIARGCGSAIASQNVLTVGRDRRPPDARGSVGEFARLRAGRSVEEVVIRVFDEDV